MKTTIKNSLVIIAMLGTITSYANLMPSSLLNEGIKKTILNLENVREGQQLLIKSEEGIIVYRESIQKTGLYKKEFDLTSLPNGNYYFEIDKDFEIKIIPFTVQATEVVFKKDEENSIFKPVFKVNNNIVSVSKLSLGLEPVEIKIYFNSGDFELIHSEIITDSQSIQRTFNLLKNVKGDYKIECKTEGRVFVKYFKV